MRRVRFERSWRYTNSWQKYFEAGEKVLIKVVSQDYIRNLMLLAFPRVQLLIEKKKLPHKICEALFNVKTAHLKLKSVERYVEVFRSNGQSPDIMTRLKLLSAWLGRPMSFKDHHY